MGCAWVSSHTPTSQMCLYGIQLVGLITRSYQAIRIDCSLALYQNKEEEKSNKVFISGSQMKRIPYRCHKALQEHNCFWALICFSAATAGGKGVNIVINVSVHNLFCAASDTPAWNTRKKKAHVRKSDNKLTSNILSWKTAFHNWRAQL